MTKRIIELKDAEAKAVRTALSERRDRLIELSGDTTQRSKVRVKHKRELTANSSVTEKLVD